MILISTFLLSCSQDDFPVLKGPYLGQTPPGMTPVIFAEGIINPDLHGCPVFSADGTEAFWGWMREKSHIMHAVYRGGKWSKPEEVTFLNILSSSGEPCLSVDGKTLFFNSPSVTEGERNVKIWYSVKGADTGDWSKPQSLPEVVNSHPSYWQISVTANRNLYFMSMESGNGDIYIAPYSRDNYGEPERLGSSINTDNLETTPYASPDESYVIFGREGLVQPNRIALAISFRLANGTWSEAQNLDKLNRPNSSQLCPNVTPDAKYLFYICQTPKGNTAFWVSAKIIEEYRP